MTFESNWAKWKILVYTWVFHKYFLEAYKEL